jgi:hypothetical protein
VLLQKQTLKGWLAVLAMNVYLQVHQMLSVVA